MFDLKPARTLEEIEAARALFRALAKWYLDDFQIDVEFQGFGQEVRDLPGHYAPPKGELLLAYDVSASPLGCIAVRPFEGGTCEIKRLYVRPEARGAGVGRALAVAILAVARELGYERAVLDTASFMTSAAKLYESLGFVDIPPYYDNPYSADTSRYLIRFLGAKL
jgi:ribosomal protein S18 acetylase RimI-like enzyme